MATIGYGQTDTGRKREANEDAFFVDDELGLYVVCDGMGGHAAGEVASRMAVEQVSQVIRNQKGELTDEGDCDALSNLVRDAITQACSAIYDEARSNSERAGMGCTLTMLVTCGAKAVMGHVGDTRLYLLRQGAVHQLTSDHTMAMHLARIGAIRMEDVPNHAYAHVLTHAVGTQSAVQADVMVLDLAPGDRYLLCSDGLGDYLTSTKQLADQLADDAPDGLPAKLIDFANASGGADNISAVVVSVPESATASMAKAAEQAQAQLDVIAAAPFFDEDFLAQLVRVVQVAELRTFGEGDVLLEEGARCAGMYAPLSGKLEVRAGGQATTVKRGDVVAESTLLNPRPSRAQLVGVEPGRVLVLGSDSFGELIRRYPFFGIGVLERLGKHLSEQVDESASGEPRL